MMLMSDGKEFSENLGQAYKAMTYHFRGAQGVWFDLEITGTFLAQEEELRVVTDNLT